jgi:hypothetical protein
LNVQIFFKVLAPDPIDGVNDVDIDPFDDDMPSAIGARSPTSLDLFHHIIAIAQKYIKKPNVIDCMAICCSRNSLNRPCPSVDRYM